MITDQLSLHSLRLCGETLSRVNKFHHGKTTSQRHDDNSPPRHDDTMIIHHDDTTTRRHDDVIYSQAVKCSVDIPVCNDAASILSVNAHGQDAHATQCYNEQRHDDVIYSQGGRRGIGRTDKTILNLFLPPRPLCAKTTSKGNGQKLVF